MGKQATLPLEFLLRLGQTQRDFASLRGLAKQAVLSPALPVRTQRDNRSLRGIAKQAALSLVFLLRLGQTQRDTNMFQDTHRKAVYSSLLVWAIKMRTVTRPSACM